MAPKKIIIAGMQFNIIILRQLPLCKSFKHMYAKKQPNNFPIDKKKFIMINPFPRYLIGHISLNIEVVSGKLKPNTNPYKNLTIIIIISFGIK